MVREPGNLMNRRMARLKSINCNTNKWIQTDGDGECIGDKFQKLITQRRTLHEVAAAYLLEPNSAAKHLNRKLLNMARTIIREEKPRAEDTI